MLCKIIEISLLKVTQVSKEWELEIQYTYQKEGNTREIKKTFRWSIFPLDVNPIL